MKITQSKLKQIIREEVGKNVDEGALPDIASAAAGIAALEADKGKQKPKRPPKLQIELYVGEVKRLLDQSGLAPQVRDVVRKLNELEEYLGDLPDS